MLWQTQSIVFLGFSVSLRQDAVTLPDPVIKYNSRQEFDQPCKVVSTQKIAVLEYGDKTVI
ncbi:MAG: hypothetical protein IJA68_02360 [Clostridia bacterium]|nr:hypothetical protein [Clostridia bacterium]